MELNKQEELGQLCEQSHGALKIVKKLLLGEDNFIREQVEHGLSHATENLCKLREDWVDSKSSEYDKRVALVLQSINSQLLNIIKKIFQPKDFKDAVNKGLGRQEIVNLMLKINLYVEKHYPKSQEESDPDPWKMAEVRKTQEAYYFDRDRNSDDWDSLGDGSPIKKFYSLLNSIQKLAYGQNLVAHEIFFCNAWPSKESEENWTLGFLKRLSDHLVAAGLNTILDQDASLLGDDPQNYMAKLKSAKYVFYFGTRTMKNKVSDGGIGMLHTEIGMMKARREKAADDNTVIPHL